MASTTYKVLRIKETGEKVKWLNEKEKRNLEDQLKDLEDEYRDSSEAYQKIEKEVYEILKNLEKYEKDYINLRERKQRAIDRQKKVSKTISTDRHGLSKAQITIQSSEQGLIEEISRLQRFLDLEERELKMIVKSLSKTEVYSKYSNQIEEKQRELALLLGKIDEKQSKIDAVTSKFRSVRESSTKQYNEAIQKILSTEVTRKKKEREILSTERTIQEIMRYLSQRENLGSDLSDARQRASQARRKLTKLKKEENLIIKNQKKTGEELELLKKLNHGRSEQIHILKEELDDLKILSYSSRKEIKRLEDRMVKAGGDKLRSQKSKVDRIKYDLVLIIEKIIKLRAEKPNAEKQFKNSLAKGEEELKKFHEEIKLLTKEIRTIRAKGDKAKSKLDKFKAKLNKQAKIVNEIRTIKLEIKNKLEGIERKLAGNKQKADFSITKLTLNPIGDDAMNENTLEEKIDILTGKIQNVKSKYSR